MNYKTYLVIVLLFFSQLDSDFVLFFKQTQWVPRGKKWPPITKHILFIPKSFTEHILVSYVIYH